MTRGRLTVARIAFIVLGVVVASLALVAWWLLIGFGCEMNTSGCKTVRLDMSRDSLSTFPPVIAIGLLMIAGGLYWRR